ncbi:SRPBCC domain-containing protein [Methanolobus halotolerans]|uniref:SRPBCC domain-containing protein n=1 Tax=Methanolobus halotolerans TaxID=2052935 RepID=A0A4E0PX59_9EURY|nr:SRPBCC domain-containing protein [Methanolobus halotolerans]TGC09197.1 SRPBCC domain-containing protein [Methanolobus halotolerans]
MQKICTDIEINAPAEQVWHILTDFENFENWNPFMLIKKGKLETGSQLEVTLHPPGSKPMSFKPTVLKVDPVREFRWIGSIWIKGIFDGEHAFRIEELDNSRTRLVQCERFRGILAPLIMHIMGENIEAGFEEMNLSLKNVSENAAKIHI